jgi:hypothetical protein
VTREERKEMDAEALVQAGHFYNMEENPSFRDLLEITQTMSLPEQEAELLAMKIRARLTQLVHDYEHTEMCVSRGVDWTRRQLDEWCPR